jgi:hypothetical protein
MTIYEPILDFQNEVIGSLVVLLDVSQIWTPSIWGKSAVLSFLMTFSALAFLFLFLDRLIQNSYLLNLGLAALLSCMVFFWTIFLLQKSTFFLH